eukprot:947783-Heterocapsa_arctica.AAC.1
MGHLQRYTRTSVEEWHSQRNPGESCSWTLQVGPVRAGRHRPVEPKSGQMVESPVMRCRNPIPLCPCTRVQGSGCRSGTPSPAPCRRPAGAPEQPERY